MRNNIFKKAIFLCWLFCAFSIFIASLKSQLLINEKLKRNINIIFPEGWGFFTKNPRDLALEIYRIEKGKAYLIDASNQSLDNFIGLSRSSRIIGYETSTLVSNILKNEWKVSTTKNIHDHINDETIIVKDKSNLNHLKKGNYLVKVFKPIPYAWSKSNQEKYNPFSVVKIKIL